MVAGILSAHSLRLLGFLGCDYEQQPKWDIYFGSEENI